MLYQPLLRKCARNTVAGEDSSDVGEEEMNDDLEIDAWDHKEYPITAGWDLGEHMLMPYGNILHVKSFLGYMIYPEPW